MKRKIALSALATAAALSLPAAAQAGASTTTSTASFNVVQQCAISGKIVDLGTYTVAQTWLDVALDLGYQPDTGGFVAGQKGNLYADYGSVLCTNGTPYSLVVQASSGRGVARFTLAGKTTEMYMFIKQIGNSTLPDATAYWPNLGQGSASVGSIGTTGTGSAQVIKGSFMVMQSDASHFLQRMVAGRHVDPLTYTLTF